MALACSVGAWVGRISTSLISGCGAWSSREVAALVSWDDGALWCFGDGVLALDGCALAMTVLGGCISWRLLWVATVLIGDLSLPLGGADCPLASTGLEEGVPGWSRSGRGWLAGTGRRDRRLEDRCCPWETGGPRGRRLEVRQERRGDRSGDESQSCGGAVGSSDILADDVKHTDAKMGVDRDETVSALSRVGSKIVPD